MIGIVKQLNDGNGLVIECSAAKKCKEANNGDQDIPCIKTCLLAKNYGARCRAWDNEQTIVSVDSDGTEIEQL